MWLDFQVGELLTSGGSKSIQNGNMLAIRPGLCFVKVHIAFVYQSIKYNANNIIERRRRLVKNCNAYSAAYCMVDALVQLLNLVPFKYLLNIWGET